MKKPKELPAEIRFRRLEDLNLTSGGGVILTIVDHLRESNGDPEQARRLLQLFVDCVTSDRPIPGPLQEFLRKTFKEYLRDPQEGRLERLLGLIRPPNRPATMQERHCAIAHFVLRRMLRPQGRDIARDDAAQEFSLSANQIEKIWEKYKLKALELEWVQRGLEGRSPFFSAPEIKRLRKMFPHVRFTAQELEQARLNCDTSQHPTKDAN